MVKLDDIVFPVLAGINEAYLMLVLNGQRPYKEVLTEAESDLERELSRSHVEIETSPYRRAVLLKEIVNDLKQISDEDLLANSAYIENISTFIYRMGIWESAVKTGKTSSGLTEAKYSLITERAKLQMQQLTSTEPTMQKRLGKLLDLGDKLIQFTKA